MFEIEPIPDVDYLYYRLHKSDLKNGKIIPGAFKERGEGEERGMSTDWNKYSNPTMLLNRVLLRGKNPNDYGIITGNVGEVRSFGLKVNHAPLDDNQSHTNITGLDVSLVEMRLNLLMTFSEWCIQIVNQ